MTTEENDNLADAEQGNSPDSLQVGSEALKHLVYTAATDIGMRRDENQDSYGVIESQNYRFFIVADGMGGVQGGATASKMAVSVVEQLLKEKTEVSAEDICQAISVANKMIFEKGAEDASLNGMGTTFVGLAFVANKVFVINVGDSRAYCIRRNYVKRLTEDHTLVMELVRSGTITVEQASNHPVSHMLTRSLGPTPEIEIDCQLSKSCPMPDDYFLLCSDGLYNMVAESEMLDIISNNNIDQATEMLIDLANQRGGTDNITLILVKADSDFPYDDEIAKLADEEALDQASREEVQDDFNSSADFLDVDNFDPFSLPPGDAGAKKPSAAPKSEPSADNTRAKEEKLAKNEQNKQDAQPAKQEILGNSNTAPTAEFPVEEIQEPRRSTQSIIITGIMAGIIGGTIVVLLSKLFFMEDNNDPEPVVLNQQNQQPINNSNSPKIPVIVKNDALIVPMRQEPDIDNGPILKMDDETPADESGSANALANLEKRKEKLLIAIEETKLNIERFKNPASVDFASNNQKELLRHADLSEKLKLVRGEIDTSTRKLAIWYGRKTKMKESEISNLANEVSVSSPEVKKKKEAFEQASWNYLKESETLRYMPSDAEQRKKVEQLIELRKKSIQEMSDAVSRAIEQEIKIVEKEITDFTIQREKLQDQLDHVEKNKQYLETLSAGDPVLIEQKKQELENMLLSLQSELDELKTLLPEMHEDMAGVGEKEEEKNSYKVIEEADSVN